MVDTLEIEQVKKEVEKKGSSNFSLEAIVSIFHMKFRFKS